MMTTVPTIFTNSAFVRSHGRNPSGRGSWAFQQTTTLRAFDAELVGDVWFAPGDLTLTAAKRAARLHFADVEIPYQASALCPIVAVMP